VTIAQVQTQLKDNNSDHQHHQHHQQQLDHASGIAEVAQTQTNPNPLPGQSTLLKLPKPEKFTAKRSNDVANWIFSMSILFSVQTLTETEELVYAISFFTEEALSWWQVIRESGQINTWVSLKDATIAYFESPTKTRDAKNNLYDLSQTGGPEGVDVYMVAFQQLLIQTKIKDEDDKSHLFVRLRPFVSGLVGLQHPSTATEAMGHAAKIESSYKRPRSSKKTGSMTPFESSGNGKKSSTPSSRNGRLGGGINKQQMLNVDSSKRSSKGSNKFSLQTLAERCKNSPAEIEVMRKQRHCFVCGEKGHSAQQHENRQSKN
jgi:Retrotransposon gag protein